MDRTLDHQLSNTPKPRIDITPDTVNSSNQKKHKVRFEEATEVFLNFPIEVFFDTDHSEDEDRFIAAGFSNPGKSLLVVHCENSSGAEIRIISARKATRKETKQIFGD